MTDRTCMIAVGRLSCSQLLCSTPWRVCVCVGDGALNHICLEHLCVSDHSGVRDSYYKRPSDVVGVLKNVRSTLRPKLVKMKAYDPCAASSLWLESLVLAVNRALFLQGPMLTQRIL